MPERHRDSPRCWPPVDRDRYLQQRTRPGCLRQTRLRGLRLPALELRRASSEIRWSSLSPSWHQFVHLPPQPPPCRVVGLLIQIEQGKYLGYRHVCLLALDDRQHFLVVLEVGLNGTRVALSSLPPVRSCPPPQWPVLRRQCSSDPPGGVRYPRSRPRPPGLPIGRSGIAQSSLWMHRRCCPCNRTRRPAAEPDQWATDGRVRRPAWTPVAATSARLTASLNSSWGSVYSVPQTSRRALANRRRSSAEVSIVSARDSSSTLAWRSERRFRRHGSSLGFYVCGCHSPLRTAIWLLSAPDLATAHPCNGNHAVTRSLA